MIGALVGRIRRSCSGRVSDFALSILFRREYAPNRRGIRRARLRRMLRSELEERTALFAARVFTLTESVRERPGGRRPADQLLDCATSVGQTTGRRPEPGHRLGGRNVGLAHGLQANVIDSRR